MDEGECPMNPLDFYRQFIAPGYLVFDVGANIGQRSKVFLELGASVVAIEPMPGSVYALGALELDHEKLAVVQMAVGSRECAYCMGTDSNNPITGTSSASPQFINAVKKSKRFGGVDHWDKIENVRMTTLDSLMESYGVPAFIKIDVEGYELEVLKGLSRPVKTLSFEFIREDLQSALDCCIRCEKLGMADFNFSLAESFELGEWLPLQPMLIRLIKLPDDGISYGDIYARP